MPTLTKGRTFINGETVTPQKLNELVDLAAVSNIVNADISPTAAIALTKLATGALPTGITVASANIVDGTIVTADLADSAATAAKIADSAVTTAKIADSNVTTAKIADSAVTAAKIATPLDLSGKSLTLPAVQPLARPLLTGYRETTVTATGTSGTITLDLNLGSIFTLQPTGNITAWTINNLPPSGVLGSFVLRTAGNGTAYTWTWPTTTRWAYGDAPIPTSTSGKFDLYSFFTFDGGTTWFAQPIGQNY
jgi:hypothetical protein